MDPAIRMIVDRLHVGTSYRKALRYFVSRLRHGIHTWRMIPRATRRKTMAMIRDRLAENREEHRAVMSGRFK